MPNELLYHTHNFTVPSATADEIKQGAAPDKFITPSALIPAMPDIVAGILGEGGLSNPLDANGYRITDVADPTDGNDAVNRNYADTGDAAVQANVAAEATTRATADATLSTAINGVAGKVLPAGGTTGQVLLKKSGTDFDAEWKSKALGTGDMLSSAYDTLGIGLDVYDATNHREGADAKILRASERAQIPGITRVASQTTSFLASCKGYRTSGFTNPGDAGGGFHVRASLADLTGYPSQSYFRSADRYMPDGSTDPTNGGYWVLSEAEPTPQMLGVVHTPLPSILAGNYATAVAAAAEQSAGLQAWLNHCVAAGAAPYVAQPTQAKVSTMLTYDPTLNDKTPKTGNISRLRLACVGVGGLAVGDRATGRLFDSATFFAPAMERTTYTWAGANGALGEDCGLILANFRACTVFLGSVAGFTVGVAYEGSGGVGAFAYNTVCGGNIRDCKHSEALRSLVANTSYGFVNENTFLGGRRGNSSLAGSLGDGYGTYFGAVSGGYAGHNNNRFIGVAYELGSPAGATYRVPVFMDGCGQQNYWYKPRNEQNKGPFGICRGGGVGSAIASMNEVDLGYNAGAFQTPYAWLQVAGAYGNLVTGVGAGISEWHSGPLAEILSSGGTAAAGRLKPPFSFMANAPSTTAVIGAPLRESPAADQIVTNARGLQINAGGVFVDIDTSNVKDFELNRACLSGFPGRPYALAFDANGALLTGSVTDSWGTELYVKGGLASVASYGGAYGGSGDNNASIRLTVRDEVKRLRLGVTSGTNAAVVQDFSIRGWAPYSTLGTNLFRPIHVLLPPGIDNAPSLSATAKPDTAGVHGKVGSEVVINRAAVAGGTTPSGWVPTGAAPSWLARPWVANRVYPVPGEIAINDAGKAYEVVTPGTAAASGGPTGTGGGTAWVATTAYSVGDIRTQGGNTYKCTVAGTSGSTGPGGTPATARQNAIVDGAVTWTFVDGGVPITDNTVQWRYVGLKAAYLALANVA